MNYLWTIDETSAIATHLVDNKKYIIRMDSHHPDDSLTAIGATIWTSPKGYEVFKKQCKRADRVRQIERYYEDTPTE